MNPMSLPDLPKPSRTSGNPRKTKFQKQNIQRKIRKKSVLTLLIPLNGLTKGGNFLVRLPNFGDDTAPSGAVSFGAFSMESGRDESQRRPAHPYPSQNYVHPRSEHVGVYRGM